MYKDYEKIKEISKEAYDFVLRALKEPIASGRHELGNGVYAGVQAYETKEREGSVYEAHRRYIDVQVILEGAEIIAVEDLETMHRYPCVREYDAEGDAELYAGNSDGVDHTLTNGDFLILLPKDAHMPGLCVQQPSTVKKIVIKVPVNH